MKFELDQKHIDEFYDLGYCILPDLFNPNEIQQISTAFDRLQSKAETLRRSQLFEGSSFVLEDLKNRVRIHRVVWAGASESVLLKFGADSRLVSSAAQIMGCDHVQQLINQAHFKLPGDGVVFDWHQDYQHRNKKTGDWQDINGRGSYVQTLLAIDDIDKDNAPVMFIPGAHKMGPLDFGGDGYDRAPNQKLIQQQVDVSQATPAIMKAGSVIFFGPYTVHGSFANESNKARRVFINGYAYPGANNRIYPGEGSGRILSIPT